jgi:ribonuclease P protein component
VRAAHRLRRRQEFSSTLRSGRRAVGRTPDSGAPVLVVHLRAARDPGPARVGYVVPRAVGTAVTRNLVRRRLRHLAGDRLAGLPEGATVVVRVLPDAARVSFAQLGAALDRALERALAAGGAT